MTDKKEKKSSLWKSIRNGLFFALVMLFIAYAFQVTKIDLSEFRKTSRIDVWTRALRALARPEFLEYEKLETAVSAPVYLPCQEGQIPSLPLVETSEPTLVAQTCGALGETVVVEGYNFPPGSTGPIGFVPGTNLELLLIKGTITADDDGRFTFEFPLPEDRPSVDVQYIRVVARQNVGSPHFTENAKATWDKIVETVFMAFLATLIGTILSFPISFLAARNLMVNVKSPLTSLALSLIGWPVGIAAGGLLARWMAQISNLQVGGIWLDIGSVLVGGGIVWFLVRWALLNVDENASMLKHLLRTIALLFAALLLVFVLYDLTSLGVLAGAALMPKLGAFAFLANFVLQSSDIMHTLMIVVVALIVGGAVSSFLGRVGQRTNERLSLVPLRIVNAFLSGAAFALLFVLIGAGIDWL